MIIDMMKRFLIPLLLIVSLALAGCSCTGSDSNNTSQKLNTSEYANNTTKPAETNATKPNAAGSEKKNIIDLSSIPPYTGSPYVNINGNEPFFREEERGNTEAFETYSNLDYLGRCGVAYANICKDLMPTEKRDEIGQVRPSGWHTVNYHDLVDGNYLYNRCHLIGYQLAGENANEKNLITGTRSLNVEGMLPFENKVDDYVERTNNHVLYRVTPIFDGNNLVASGVLMEAYSVEDSGKGVMFCIYCYNVQPGIDINYANGESQVSASGNTTNNEAATSPANTENVSADYILNTNTRKFHRPDCSSVSKMKEKNKQAYSGNRQDLINQGYEPCGSCHP